MVAQATMPATKMTWKEATFCYIHNVKRETDGFHKTASAFGAFFRTALLSRFSLSATAALVCDDALDWVPGVDIATIGDNIIGWPMAAFVAYSVYRISKIRRDANSWLR